MCRPFRDVREKTEEKIDGKTQYQKKQTNNLPDDSGDWGTPIELPDDSGNW